ncbi:DUF6665 family protein [Notoacmeibacter ruber]|uniref:Uncharacterized protein n=1 Tax=Notoacmeibacter ruber TaxID=2670375 RepID=A0A3L7JFH5_9HYPH|nr:DUF6665 family protein [Notoacmeibacter ruber]RLQ88341.1 hypothetical protein D8780_09120 [Notoacmeibacter ruber]
MALRPPSRYRDAMESIADRSDALGYEIAAEKASSLGRAGKSVGEALEALRQFEAENDADQNRLGETERAMRSELLRRAARATHAYFIQRELCGLRRHHDAIAQYRIPQSVLARLGAA